MAECSWPFSVTSPAPMRGATRSPWPLRCLCTWPAKILRITPSPRRCAFTWISLIRPTRPSPRTQRSIWKRGHLWQFIPGDKRIIYLGPFKILPEGLCIAALKTSSGSKLKAWKLTAKRDNKNKAKRSAKQQRSDLVIVFLVQCSQCSVDQTGPQQKRRATVLSC